MDNFKEFLTIKYPVLAHLDEIQARHISEFMDYRLNKKAGIQQRLIMSGILLVICSRYL